MEVHFHGLGQHLALSSLCNQELSAHQAHQDPGSRMVADLGLVHGRKIGRWNDVGRRLVCICEVIFVCAAPAKQWFPQLVAQAGMINRTSIQAIKALLELAQEPSRWRSVNDLAAAQALPAPYLEQLLLRLRRAGVLEARRGRQGGYRLVCRPADLSLARVLLAVDAWPGAPVPQVVGAVPSVLPKSPGEGAPDPATEHVAALLQQRLARAIERELERLTLEELLFDLRSARASLIEDGGLILG